MLKIDHFLIAARNHYDCTDRLYDQAGFASYEGGWFPDEGLAQTLVPLGNDQYIEIEGVVDLDVLQVPDGPLEAGRYIVDHVADGDALAGWWVLTDDLEAVRRRLGTELSTVTKRLPDGSIRSGHGTPLSLEALRQGLPVFWSHPDMSTHPARTPVPHSVEPRGIAWMEVGGDEAVMREWLGEEADQVPLRYVGGAPGMRAVGINTDDGVVVLRPSGKQLVEQ
jgi:hypothetical protein